jgi:hypothetical protein
MEADVSAARRWLAEMREGAQEMPTVFRFAINPDYWSWRMAEWAAKLRAFTGQETTPKEAEHLRAVRARWAYLSEEPSDK